MLQHRICLYVKICDTNATNKKGLYLNACLNNKEVHWLHQMNFEQHFVAVNKCTCFINIWQHYRWTQTRYLTRLPSSEMMFYHHTVSQNSCKNDISTKRLISLNNQTNKIMVMLLITRSTVGLWNTTPRVYYAVGYIWAFSRSEVIKSGPTSVNAL